MRKREKKFKRCPRCNFKTFNSAKVCGNCGLNYEKFSLATNEEGKNALKKGERERIIWTGKLPSDLSKKKLFWISLLFGWTGVHLFKVGKLSRAIFHIIGLMCFGGCVIISLFEETKITFNLFNIMGVVWIFSMALVIADIIDILFGRFKVPVSLPYTTKKEEK